MMERKLRQDRFPLVGQIDIDLPPVNGAPATHDQLSFFESIDKFNRGVMANLHPLGQLPDRWLAVDWQPFHHKEQLVLPWLKTIFAGFLRAEAEKSSNLVTKLRQNAVVLDTEGFATRLHPKSIS